MHDLHDKVFRDCILLLADNRATERTHHFPFSMQPIFSPFMDQLVALMSLMKQLDLIQVRRASKMHGRV